MATFHDRTIAPKFQRGLLRAGGVPCRVLTSDEVVAEVEADFASLIAQPWPEMPPEPLLPTAKARAIHSRRALEQAADHGVALLAALGLPQPMRHDIKTHDPAAIGDALDLVIAHLDALDAPGEDLEDGGDAEDDGTAEHSLGAPERHPWTPAMGLSWYRPANGSYQRAKRYESQVSWAQGTRLDGEREAEAGYDLACDEDELDDDQADKEPSIGWPNDFRAKLDPNQTYQASMDREEVNEDGSGDEPYPWRLHSPDALRIAAEICDG